MDEFDFSGWATKANLKCSDGRVIMKDAFKDNDGQKVPLVWNHQHNDPNEVLGHALLENREEGVYAYCKLNDTESGKTAKLLIQHGDVDALSIYANQLKQNMSNVIHGNIREVSLVLAGANPGAFIDSIIMHGEEHDDEGIIYTGENIELFHASYNNQNNDKKEDSKMEDEDKKNENEETIGDVFNSLTDKQKNVVEYMVTKALENAGNSSDNKNDENNDENKEDNNMKHNVFDQDEKRDDVLSHSDLETIFKRGKQLGSLREAVNEQVDTLGDALAHATTYGINNIDYLFPEAKSTTNVPQFIQRDMGWVQKVMNGVHHTPFSRIKSVFADITEDDARARGYIKGKLKKEEVFGLLKRTTTPTTIYKKQKLDRDDVIDITDFDVVAWLKSEMRIMLDEEIARAILVGDGRLTSSDDKINEQNIRPIYNDAELYTIQGKVTVAANATSDDKAKAVIRAAVKNRKDYKGSGNPTCFTTEDFLTDALLIEDSMGHRMYKDPSEVAAAMRVKEIVTVPVMEGMKGPGNGDLVAVIVNLNDYSVGADKGGAINMFDDFDIDYNQMKYLIETRCSGALTKPKSAITLEMEVSA